MSEEKPKESVRECLEALEKLTNTAGDYAYRGQENAEWEVISSASRRLIKSRSTKLSFISYHREEILNPARMDGYGIKDGQDLSDLELLADLQHHGAATCLIDFTRNFFVALWFAAYKDSEKDGKVFILNTNDTDIFCAPTEEDLAHEIEDILNFRTTSHQENQFPWKQRKKRLSWREEAPLYWCWSPSGINRRILKQDSLFIFGEEEIDESNLVGCILISKDHKADILEGELYT